MSRLIVTTVQGDTVLHEVRCETVSVGRTRLRCIDTEGRTMLFLEKWGTPHGPWLDGGTPIDEVRIEVGS